VRGKLTMALTYLTSIAAGLVFIYLTVATGGQILPVVGAILLVLVAAYLGWREFFARGRV